MAIFCYLGQLYLIFFYLAPDLKTAGVTCLFSSAPNLKSAVPEKLLYGLQDIFICILCNCVGSGVMYDN